VKLEQVRRAETALAQRLGSILNKSGSTAAPRRWQDIWNANVGGQLTAVVEGAQSENRGSALTPAAEKQVAQQLRDFLVDYNTPLDPAVSAGTKSTYQGGRGDAREDDSGGAIYITEPGMQAYLRGRFPEHAITVVRDVKRLMGGYSKETYIIQLDRPSGAETIVIRKDGYGLPTGSSVASEYDIIQEVHALGLPVPEPLWLETDPRHFSASFLAVGFLPGIPAHLNVPEDSETRNLWCDNLAEVIARLHRETAVSGRDVREVIREDIADLQRRIEDRERAPHPGLAFGMAWLVDHLGDLEGRPACRIHGDVGFHNILMRDNRILALLDWEYSHYSDPIEDLVYVRPFLEQLDGWDRFLATYQAAAGFSFDPLAARYFSVWKEVRNLVACLGSLNSLLLPQVKDVPLCVAGTIYIPKYEIAVLDAIIEGN
jgi:aminoglycoside phosphotransferase (APT) family kinase protein